MLKAVIKIFLLALILVLLYVIGTGFVKRNDVVLLDYSLSENKKEITLNVGVMSSMGYVRAFKDMGGGVKPHYLNFYSTFGGINSNFGVKDKFILKLEEFDNEIYFNRKDGGYQLVLQKDDKTGMWVRP